MTKSLTAFVAILVMLMAAHVTFFYLDIEKCVQNTHCSMSDVKGITCTEIIEFTFKIHLISDQERIRDMYFLEEKYDDFTMHVPFLDNWSKQRDACLPYFNLHLNAICTMSVKVRRKRSIGFSKEEEELLYCLFMWPL